MSRTTDRETVTGKSIWATLMDAISGSESGIQSNFVFFKPRDSSEYDWVSATARDQMAAYISSFVPAIGNEKMKKRAMSLDAYLGLGGIGNSLIGMLGGWSPDVAYDIVGHHGGYSALTSLLSGANGYAAARGLKSGGVLDPKSLSFNMGLARVNAEMAYANNFNDDGSINIDYTHGLDLQQTSHVQSQVMSDRRNYENWARSMIKKGAVRRSAEDDTLSGLKDSAFNDFKNGVNNTKTLQASFNKSMKDFTQELNGFLASITKMTGSYSDAVQYLQSATNGKAFVAGEETDALRRKAVQSAMLIRTAAADAGISSKELFAYTDAFGGMFAAASGMDSVGQKFGNRTATTSMGRLSAVSYAGWLKNNPQATEAEKERMRVSIEEQAINYGTGDTRKMNILLGELVDRGQVSKEEALRIAGSGDANLMFRKLSDIYGGAGNVNRMLANGTELYRLEKKHALTISDLHDMAFTEGVRGEYNLKGGFNRLDSSKRRLAGQLAVNNGEYAEDIELQLDELHAESLLDTNALKKAGIGERKAKALRKYARENGWGVDRIRQWVSENGGELEILDSEASRVFTGKVRSEFSDDWAKKRKDVLRKAIAGVKFNKKGTDKENSERLEKAFSETMGLYDDSYRRALVSDSVLDAAELSDEDKARVRKLASDPKKSAADILAEIDDLTVASRPEYTAAASAEAKRIMQAELVGGDGALPDKYSADVRILMSKMQRSYMKGKEVLKGTSLSEEARGKIVKMMDDKKVGEDEIVSAIAAAGGNTAAFRENIAEAMALDLAKIGVRSGDAAARQNGELVGDFAKGVTDIYGGTITDEERKLAGGILVRERIRRDSNRNKVRYSEAKTAEQRERVLKDMRARRDAAFTDNKEEAIAAAFYSTDFMNSFFRDVETAVNKKQGGRSSTDEVNAAANARTQAFMSDAQQRGFSNAFAKVSAEYKLDSLLGSDDAKEFFSPKGLKDAYSKYESVVKAERTLAEFLGGKELDEEQKKVITRKFIKNMEFLRESKEGKGKSSDDLVKLTYAKTFAGDTVVDLQEGGEEIKDLGLIEAELRKENGTTAEAYVKGEAFAKKLQDSEFEALSTPIRTDDMPTTTHGFMIEREKARGSDEAVATGIVDAYAKEQNLGKAKTAELTALVKDAVARSTKADGQERINDAVDATLGKMAGFKEFQKSARYETAKKEAADTYEREYERNLYRLAKDIQLGEDRSDNGITAQGKQDFSSAVHGELSSALRVQKEQEELGEYAWVQVRETDDKSAKEVGRQIGKFDHGHVNLMLKHYGLDEAVKKLASSGAGSSLANLFDSVTVRGDKAKVDANNDGTVTEREVGEYLGSLAQGKTRDGKKDFKDITDGDEFAQELAALYGGEKSGEIEDKLKAIFKENSKLTPQQVMAGIVAGSAAQGDAQTKSDAVAMGVALEKARENDLFGSEPGGKSPEGLEIIDLLRMIVESVDRLVQK